MLAGWPSGALVVTRPADDLAGKVLLIKPSMQMVEVLFASRDLDFAMCVKLDMEGGRTGLHGHFRPSRITD